MDTSPPSFARRRSHIGVLGVLVVVLSAVLLVAGPEVAAGVVGRSAVDHHVPSLVRAPDDAVAPVVSTTAPPTTSPAPTTTSTVAPSTSTSVAPSTTTTVPSPVRTSLDFGGGLLVDLITPPGPGPHPTVVYVHGGGWVGGEHRELPAEFGLTTLAERGWAVASVGYRLADLDRGVDISHQTTEVSMVFDWIRTDGGSFGLGDRVVGIGHSAGAHLVSLAAATLDRDTAPLAVIGVAGLYDFDDDIRGNALLAPVLPHALGCEPSECPAERIASFRPATHADPADPRVVLVHGTDDPIAPLRTADDFTASLRTAGVPVEEVVVDGAGHFDDALGDAVREALDRILAA